MRAFIGVLEAAPPADIINKDQPEIGLAGAHIGEKLLQPFAATDIQTAFAFVSVGTDNFDINTRGVFQDLVALVLCRILLMFCRHAHILRGAASKRQSRRFCLHLWIEPNRFSYLSRIRRGARHGKSYL